MFSKVINENNLAPLIFFPIKEEDLDIIIKALKKHNVIVNLSSLDDRLKLRINDFLSGYAYALNIKKRKLELDIFILEH